MNKEEKNVNRFYIYRWIRLDTNQPFHIGKGCGRRAYSVSYGKRNKYFIRIHNKIKCKVEIFIKNLTEKQAFEKEIEFIALYKKFGLCETNLTNGGEGATGYKQKPESIEKRKMKMIGFKHSEESKQKNREWHLGRKMSKESIEKTVKANTGRKNSPETIKKMSERVRTKKEIEKSRLSRIGINPSEKTRLKMSISAKKRKATPETCAKISSSNKGRKISKETKKRMSISKIGLTGRKAVAKNKYNEKTIEFANVVAFCLHFSLNNTTVSNYIKKIKKPRKNSDIYNFDMEWTLEVEDNVK